MNNIDFIKLVSLNINTFKEIRQFCLNIFKTEQNVILFEKKPLNRLLPLYIDYIESKGLNFLELLCYYHYDVPEFKFNELKLHTIICVIKRIENNNLIFNRF